MKERCLLDRLLEPGALRVMFQPIFECVSTHRRLHALECLIRGPKGTNMEDPDVLLEYVRRKREESLLDRVCVATALAAAATLPGTPHLCLNVHASTLGRDRDFVSFLSDTTTAHGIAAHRLTIEIVEHAPPWDGPSFQAAIADLRRLRVSIALDDVGLGQSNYKMILDARPDFFKLDRYFVQGVHADYHRRAVLESVAQLASRFGGRVVAEGVEDRQDLDAVMAQGVELIQGFFFSRALTHASVVAAGVFDGLLPLTAVPENAGGPRA
jgi:EAL domain-containing protein (putative c-di-GMP-specific phosphodiesterase class I)